MAKYELNSYHQFIEVMDKKIQSKPILHAYTASKINSMFIKNDMLKSNSYRFYRQTGNSTTKTNTHKLPDNLIHLTSSSIKE